MFTLPTVMRDPAMSTDSGAKLNYEQVSSTRDVSAASFAKGTIHYKFQTNGTKWWMPSKSYLRVRCSLKNGAGDPLKVQDGIAPNMALCANLFQNCEFRVNDKVVSRVSENVAQIDALDNRLNKSKSWLDGVAQYTNFWNPDFRVRQAEVCVDGSNAQFSEVLSTPVQMGYLAGETATLVGATGVITFSGGDATLIWEVDDYIVLGGQPLLITIVTDATHITVAGGLGMTGDLGATTNFSRVRDVKYQDNARKTGEFELIWQPPLSIFKVDHALPAGKYELVFNPQVEGTYQRGAVETLFNSVPGTDYNFTVTSMYFITQTTEGPRCDDLTYLLDLEQTRCQNDTVPGISFSQRYFEVSPATYALTVAYQDARVNSDTRYSSTKFKSYNVGNDLTVDQSRTLNRFFLNYAGSSYPQPDADCQYVPGSTDFTVQRYAETLMYSNGWEDAASPESLLDWVNRGSYFHFKITREGTDRSTRLSVNQQFAAGTDLTNTRVLVFDHARQVAKIRIQDGQVVDVQLEDN